MPLQEAAFKHASVRKTLFDFTFLELNMFAYDRVVFPHGELIRLRARVLLGNVIVARIRCAHELNQKGTWFCHGRNSICAPVRRDCV